MHEASIVEEMLEIADREVVLQGAQRINRISLQIGVLSGVVPEALQFAFGSLSLGTLAEGAVLEIVRVPLTLHCDRCGRSWDGEHPGDLCPICGAELPSIVAGQELRLLELDLEIGETLDECIT